MFGGGLSIQPRQRGEVIGGLWGHSEATEQRESQLFKRQIALGKDCFTKSGGRGVGREGV